jgi:transcriptional regulator with XRE-family HTH domain
MTRVSVWTGRDTRALRAALRMSTRTFAEYLGVAIRTVSYWESADLNRRPRADMQEILDTAWQRASEHAKIVFEQLRANDVAGQEGEMDRRNFLPVAAIPLTAGLAEVVSILTPVVDRTQSLDSPLGSAEVARLASRAKALYQQTRYQDAMMLMPRLLQGVREMSGASGGTMQRQDLMLCASAYHVLSSLLLKLDDPVLATISGQRALSLAQTSGDAVSIAASSRVVIHALMRSGHADRAVAMAAEAAELLSRSARCLTPEAISVRGALFLRAAVAAARMNDRQTATLLLIEASRAARELGHDGNEYWTSFGPTNVQLHRVHVALALGDGGTAVGHALKVDIAKVALPDGRRACLRTSPRPMSSGVSTRPR